ncbi:MAG TPA: hypothetical protein VF023_00235 [Bryobacteraceae bacterium]|jgi:hypothetical protein
MSPEGAEMLLRKLLMGFTALTLGTSLLPAAATNELPLAAKNAIQEFMKLHTEPAPVHGPSFAPNHTQLYLPGITTAAPSSTCAIPLQQMRTEHSARFAAKSATLPGTMDQMPSSFGPAPACNTN